ncbi:MAG: SDR family oxidoreductase [Bdellovibrionales bacterium]|nr:SDR family oxidoreductase [Bdellovibrionales bacterium]
MEPRSEQPPQLPAITPDELARCTQILEQISTDMLPLAQLPEEERIRFLTAAGQVVRPDRAQAKKRIKALRKFKRAQREGRDRVVRASTHIRSARRDAVFVAPERQLLLESPAAPRAQLERPRDCYVCKTEFRDIHFFYDSMCPPCAALNYEKRFQTADLTGQVAVITGARLKIGYQAALMMLRAGARVIVTTRFPQDAALRFAREPEFGVWGSRLQVHGLDLRHSPSVEVFTRLMNEHLDRLDILINNAAQTVRRPPGFYAHLLAAERTPFHELPEAARSVLMGHQEIKRALQGLSDDGGDQRWLSNWHAGRAVETLGITASASLSQIPYQCDDTATEYFPEGRLDADFQQVDQRRMNSWRMQLADVPTAEMLEVHLVNAVAPFILCAKLKPLMLRERTWKKHIVNVSAMEGKFARHTKTDKHPHTNMAKAALNMMTLTSARDYARDGIYMNAVDTGWVTDEDPAQISARKQEEHDFQPPLDIVDGAARVIDPIFSGFNPGNHAWGNVLKDYAPTEW